MGSPPVAAECTYFSKVAKDLPTVLVSQDCCKHSAFSIHLLSTPVYVVLKFRMFKVDGATSNSERMDLFVWILPPLSGSWHWGQHAFTHVATVSTTARLWEVSKTWILYNSLMYCCTQDERPCWETNVCSFYRIASCSIVIVNMDLIFYNILRLILHLFRISTNSSNIRNLINQAFCLACVSSGPSERATHNVDVFSNNNCLVLVFASEYTWCNGS